MSTKKQKNPTLADLSPEEVRHLLRPREGFTTYVKQMFDLYAANPDALRIKGLNLPALREELEAIDELGSKESAAARVYEQLHETRMLRSSNVYRAALQIYARAQPLAESDGDTLHSIAGFAGFLKRNRRSKKASKAPATPPTI